MNFHHVFASGPHFRYFKDLQGDMWMRVPCSSSHTELRTHQNWVPASCYTSWSGNKMMASWLQTLRFKMHWSVIYMCSGAPVLPWKNIMKRPKLAMLGQILLILVQLYYSCTTRCTCCRLVLHRKRWQLLRATRIHLRSRAGGTPGLGLDTGHQWFPKVSGSCEQCSKPLLVDDYRGLYYPIYWGF